jgi:cyclohexanone monooxygenase
MTVQVFEAGGRLGGVWYWNCYPGARVDSPGPIDQYSREGLWRKWQFSELYPSWQELRAYFRYVDEQLGLSRDIRFNRQVDEASFEPTRNRWTVRSNDGSVARARYSVLCTGLGSKPDVPNLSGLSDSAEKQAPCRRTRRPSRFPARIIRSRLNAIPLGSWCRSRGGSSPTREKR